MVGRGVGNGSSTLRVGAGWLLVGWSVVIGGGCEREAVKQVAKANVFAPAPPDPMAVRAKEPIAAGALVTDAAVRERINRMGSAEIGHRLDGYRFAGRQVLSAERGERRRKSQEEIQIRLRSDGAFSVDLVVQGGDEQHIVFVDELLFVRHNLGRWRASRDPTEERLHWLEEAYRLWPAFVELGGESLRFSSLGEGTRAGRPALRFAVTLAAAERTAEAMPSALLSGPADETAVARDRRLAMRANLWRTHAQPTEGGGELWVDRETGVPLAVEVSGTFIVRDDPDEPARITWELEAAFSEVGRAQEIKIPRDYVEEYVRRKIITRPLEFLEGHSDLIPSAATEAQPAGGSR